MVTKLDVLVDGVIVGALHNTDPLSFSYSDDCLAGLARAPFSGIIPIRHGNISTIEVTAFFENLLPEGDQRTILESRYHVSTLFGLLSVVGADTAGSIVIIPSGQHPLPDDYVSVKWSHEPHG